MPYINIDGVREFTSEDIERFKYEQAEQDEYNRLHPPCPTSEQRIAQLEEELKATKILLGLEA